MNVQSLNFWLGLITTSGFLSGMVWGVIKGYNSLVAKNVEHRHSEQVWAEEFANLQTYKTHVESELREIRKDLTPNGKNTQRLGDIAARSEEKLDNLMAFMNRYAEKVDSLEREIAEHLGYHSGAEL